MKKLLSLGLVLLTAVAAHGSLHLTNTWSAGWANGNVIPDNNASGWTDTRTFGLTPGYEMVNNTLTVALNLSGGWNGDLYAYLVNSDGGFAVLLDRVGPGNYGYGTSGMNVWLTDVTLGVLGNIDSTATPSAGGLYSRDGHAGSLASFNGYNNPSSTWTLFVADRSGGGVTTVENWGLQMEIVAVPEVETWIAAALAGTFGAFWLNRQMWGTKERD